MKKKNLSIVSLLIAIMMAMTLLVGCGGDTTTTNETAVEAETAEETEIEQTLEGVADAFAESEIVVVMPEAAQGWIAAVLFFAERRGEELVDEGIGGFRVITSANVAEQAGQLDELVAQNVDVIVLFPHSDELDFAAQGFIDAGIPLFVFNRNVNVYFESRLVGSNQLMAEGNSAILLEELDGEGIVAYLSIPAVGSTNVERVEPFLEIMEANPGIELIELTTTVFSPEDALQVTTDALTANPHIDAFYVLDDQHAMGVLQAIQEANRTDIRVITSMGSAQFILPIILEEENIDIFTATFSPMMIIDAIDLAVEYLNGRRDFPELTVIAPEFISRENAEDYIDPTSPW